MDTDRQRQYDRQRRIGLIGAECSGKSTLAGALAVTLPACVVDERLRDFVGEHGRTPRIDEQTAILREQAARQDRMAADCRHPWLIADPAPLMTAIYSVEYFDDSSLLAEGLAHARDYDLLVWCAPDPVWEPDGNMRDGPERRASTERTITGVLGSISDAKEPPPQVAPVIRVAGDLPARVRSVTSSIAALGL